jgi:hypothetical protein
MIKTKCPYCPKMLKGADGVYSHVKKVHPNRKRAHLRPARADDDESFASRAIQAELDHAMGISNPDYDSLVEPYK